MKEISNSSIGNILAKLCCEEALKAVEEDCYGVGAVIINEQDEVVCSARNQVFKDGFQSQRHAEMEVLNILERDHADMDCSKLTLYVSLEPCVMCYGRILLAGITKVRYLVKDSDGGFADHFHLLPPAFRNLESQLDVKRADVDKKWIKLAEEIIAEKQNRKALRQKVVKAWSGKL